MHRVDIVERYRDCLPAAGTHVSTERDEVGVQSAGCTGLPDVTYALDELRVSIGYRLVGGGV